MLIVITQTITAFDFIKFNIQNSASCQHHCFCHSLTSSLNPQYIMRSIYLFVIQHYLINDHISAYLIANIGIFYFIFRMLTATVIMRVNIRLHYFFQQFGIITRNCCPAIRAYHKTLSINPFI